MMNKRRWLSWLRQKRRLSLRLRLALWSAALVLVLSFGLLLFVNSEALGTFPRIIRNQTALRIKTKPSASFANGCPTIDPAVCIFGRPANPLERALFLELRNISLIGLLLAAILGGAGAYLLAGIALRPVRKVSGAAKKISANTLHTRLALDGPHDEVKELADTFDAMLERLERTFDSQNRFVADVAHELRTPLASLRTNMEVVSSDAEATIEDYRAMAATQERALTRLERLIADLLILATATSEQPVTRSSVSVGPLIEEVMGDLQAMACAKEVALQFNGEVEVIVPGNGQLLAHVFANLIENAIYYNQRGGTVTIAIDAKEDWAVVKVADTGIGMSAEQQEHIFERFYRADGSRSRHNGGAGLGLSIVSAIVQQHGGQVQVESTPGIGSTFTVLLPLSA